MATKTKKAPPPDTEPTSVNTPEVDAVLDAITAAREKLGLSERAMALAAGLDIAGVQRVFKRRNRPQLESVIKLGLVVGRKIELSPK